MGVSDCVKGMKEDKSDTLTDWLRQCNYAAKSGPDLQAPTLFYLRP